VIKFNFKRIFKARDIERPYTYLVKHGFTPNTATRMANENIKMLNLKNIETLCQLWQCTPNDLLEWVPDKYSVDATTHPLRELIRKEIHVNIKEILNAIPISQLAEVEKFIKEKVQS
jgi:DNA-binding Xre family transcriptional regulator